jgi:hypothetical protein
MWRVDVVDEAIRFVGFERRNMVWPMVRKVDKRLVMCGGKYLHGIDRGGTLNSITLMRLKDSTH